MMRHLYGYFLLVLTVLFAGLWRAPRQRLVARSDRSR
jgi:hypothetical protein